MKLAIIKEFFVLLEREVLKAISFLKEINSKNIYCNVNIIKVNCINLNLYCVTILLYNVFILNYLYFYIFSNISNAKSLFVNLVINCILRNNIIINFKLIKLYILFSRFNN